LILAIFGFADFTDHACIGDVDLGLALGAFVRFPGKRLEVLRLAHVLEFLDVGVVDAETKLVELLLHALDDLA
jgi:hypothetical protein